MLAHHSYLAHPSRLAVSVLFALLVAACQSEGGAPTSLDGQATSGTGAVASAEVCAQLLDAAPRGSLTWEEKKPHEPLTHPYVSIVAYPETKTFEGTTRHELALVASTLADPEAWTEKGIAPSKEFHWTVEISSSTASPGVGVYAEPALREYEGGTVRSCDGSSGAGGSSTSGTTSTIVTITERTPTIVRGVIETEWDRVTFEAPIITRLDGPSSLQPVCCLEDEPSSN